MKTYEYVIEFGGVTETDACFMVAPFIASDYVSNATLRPLDNLKWHLYYESREDNEWDAVYTGEHDAAMLRTKTGIKFVLKSIKEKKSKKHVFGLIEEL